MDIKQKQFVRMMDMVIDLMKQARSAASLAPKNHLSDTLLVMIREAEGLRDDQSAWFYGQDSRGRMMTESGQFIGETDG